MTRDIIGAPSLLSDGIRLSRIGLSLEFTNLEHISTKYFIRRGSFLARHTFCISGLISQHLYLQRMHNDTESNLFCAHFFRMYEKPLTC